MRERNNNNKKACLDNDLIASTGVANERSGPPVQQTLSAKPDGGENRFNKTGKLAGDLSLK